MRTKFYSKKQILSLIALPLAASAASVMITVPTTATAADIVIPNAITTTTTWTWSQLLQGDDTLTVTNSGVLDLSGESDTAVIVDATATAVEIYNAGQIIGDQNYYAIFANGSSSGTIISNQKTDTLATNSPLIFVPNTTAIHFEDDLDGSLTNSGLIQAGGQDPTDSTVFHYTTSAKAVHVGEDISGTLDNSGTIVANAYNDPDVSSYSLRNANAFGIYVGEDISGTLDNSGTIAAYADAGPGDAYTHDAVAYGILVNGLLSGDLNNSGTIIADADAAEGGSSTIDTNAIAKGVSVNNILGGTLNNNDGTISAIAHAAAYGTGYQNLAFAGAIGVDLGNLAGALNNSGTINATAVAIASDNASYGSAYAEAVGVRDSLSGDLINMGTISANASAQALSGSYENSARARAIGVEIDGDLSGTLDNQGTIEASAFATADDAYGAWATAIGVLINGDLEGTLTNADSDMISATISKTDLDETGTYAAVTASGMAIGINIAYGDLTGTLTNMGNITATVEATAKVGTALDPAEYANANAFANEAGYGGVAGIFIGGTDTYTNYFGYWTGSPSYFVTTWTSIETQMRFGNITDRLANSGTISATARAHATAFGNSAASANADARNAVGIMMGSIGTNAELVNSGEISATVDAKAMADPPDGYAEAYGGSATGLYSYGGIGFNGTLENSEEDSIISGSVQVHATATGTNVRANALGVYAHGIDMWGNIDPFAALDNKGTISGSVSATASAKAKDYGDARAHADDAYGLAMHKYSIASNGKLINDGTISGTLTATAKAEGTGEPAESSIAKAYGSGHRAFGMTMNDIMGLLDNNGEISGSIDVNATATGHYAYGQGDANDAFGLILDNVRNYATLDNSGTISGTITVDATANANLDGEADAEAFADMANGLTIRGGIESGASVENNGGTISGTMDITAKALAPDGDNAWADAHGNYASGIYLDDGIDGYGSLENSGIISAAINAKATASAYGSAYATATADYGAGIFMDRYAEIETFGSLVNTEEGTISAELNMTATAEAEFNYARANAYGGNVAGILGYGGWSDIEELALLDNSGIISAAINAKATANNGTNTAPLSEVRADARGYYATGIYLDKIKFLGFLDNSGTISASIDAEATAEEAEYAEANASAYGAAGIYLEGGIEGYGTLENSGTDTISASIDVTATADATDEAYAGAWGRNAEGLHIGSDYDNYGGIAYGATLDNSGSISASIIADATATVDPGGAYASAEAIGDYAVGLHLAGNSYLQDYGDISYGGMLDNSGSITASMDISAKATADDGIAKAYARAEEVYGIYMDYGSIVAGGTLDNDEGTISATVTVNATATGSEASANAAAYGVAGIYMPDGSIGFDGLLDNSGTISASATVSANAVGSGGMANAGFIPSGPFGSAAVAGIWTEGIAPYGELNNSGTISGSATANGNAGIDNAAAAARGLFMYYGIAPEGLLDNSGTISGSATANNLGYSANALAGGVTSGFGSSQNGMIVNQEDGTISGHAVAKAAWEATAIAGGYTIYGSLYGPLDNWGTISGHAEASAASSALAMAGGVTVFGTINSTLNNYGTISAIADAVAAGSDSAAYGLFAFNLDGTLNNSGTISGRANYGGNGYSLSLDGGSGTVNNEVGGLLWGNLYADGGVSVNNSGTVHIPAGADAFINNVYDQDANGTFSIGVKTVDEYGNLTVDGTATFVDGTGLHVELEPGYSLVDGDILNDVISAGTLAVTDVGDLSITFPVVTDNSPLLFDFTATQIDGPDNTVDLAVTRNMFLTDIFNNGPAPFLDEGCPEGLEDLCLALIEAGSEEEIEAIIASIMPVFQGDFPRAILDALADARRVIRIRQDGQQGANAGDTSLSNNFWTKAFGSKAEQDDNSNAFGYEADTWGVLIGVDGAVGTSARLGAAFAYSTTDVDNNSPVFHEGDVDSFQGIVYGTFILNDVSDIDWQASYAFHNNEFTRETFGGTAHGDYDGWSAHFGARYDYRIAMGDTANFTPSFGIQYTRVEDDAYTETGTGVLLNVDSKDLDELILGVDGTLAVGLGTHALFSMNAGLGFDVLDEDGTITSSWVGDPLGTSFQTTGVDTSVWLVRGGAGLTFGADDGMQVSVNYDIEVRDDFDNQSVSLKLNIPF